MGDLDICCRGRSQSERGHHACSKKAFHDGFSLMTCGKGTFSLE
jgi:hypothetical protein